MADINRIEFIVTWQCGGRCKHCQIGGDINKHSTPTHVPADYAVDAVKKLTSVYDIKSVMTFGGEPLYYPEVTAAIHKAATECGIKTRQIITNGYFTNNAEKSKLVANALADAGVNNLLLSVDAFHQERIPIEPVYRFACDVIDAEIPGFCIHPVWLVNKDHDNPYNMRTRELLDKFADLPVEIGRGNDIFLMGNAAEFLREYYDEPDVPESYSESSEVTSITILPNGDVDIGGVITRI